jgi:hypothetical protein
MDKLTHKIIFILNDIIDLNFEEDKVFKRLSRTDDLINILIENNIIFNEKTTQIQLIEMAKKRYYERLEHEQYIHSLS